MLIILCVVCVMCVSVVCVNSMDLCLQSVFSMCDVWVSRVCLFHRLVLMICVQFVWCMGQSGVLIPRIGGYHLCVVCAMCVSVRCVNSTDWCLPSVCSLCDVKGKSGV